MQANNNLIHSKNKHTYSLALSWYNFILEATSTRNNDLDHGKTVLGVILWFR